MFLTKQLTFIPNQERDNLVDPLLHPHPQCPIRLVPRRPCLLVSIVLVEQEVLTNYIFLFFF